MNGWKKLKWNRENTLKENVPNKPGMYKLYNKNGVLLYVGHAKKLRHRVQSYRQKDCFAEHPTKPHLRGRIASYHYKTMPVKKAQKKERKIKNTAAFNFK